jgi:hypothetical protein
MLNFNVINIPKHTKPEKLTSDDVKTIFIPTFFSNMNTQGGGAYGPHSVFYFCSPLNLIVKALWRPSVITLSIYLSVYLWFLTSGELGFTFDPLGL